MKVDLTRTYTRADLSTPWPPRALDVSDNNAWHALKSDGIITSETAVESEDGYRLDKTWEVNIGKDDMVAQYNAIISDQYVIYSNNEIISYCDENNITYQVLQIALYDDDGVTQIASFPVNQFYFYVDHIFP
jgi:hypothetical protein